MRPSTQASAGAPRVYSDLAIECRAMLKAVYGLTLRATEGLLASVLDLLRLPVPDDTTLSRRLQCLDVSPPRPVARSQPLHLVVDAAGVKLYGGGEWQARRLGPGKRRAWRKKLETEKQPHNRALNLIAIPLALHSGR